MQEPVHAVLTATNPEEEASTLAQPRPDPLFVVGMFRSGTSLLYALLNQHPQIALMYEADLAHLQALFWMPRDTTRWLRRWNFWNSAIARHKFDTSAVPDGIQDLGTAIRTVYSQYAQQKKKTATVWGCKSPTYHDEVQRLHRVFPNAKFIVIWRDIRHVCRSILQAAETSPFFNRRGMTLRAILGTLEMKEQYDSLLAQGVQIHQLDYEELVKDPSGHMQAICGFLDIPYDERMSNLRGADRGAISDFRHHTLVKGEKIVQTRNGSEGIPPELLGKIERYIGLWRKRYDNTWPKYPEKISENAGLPTAWERFSDRVNYTLFQFTHHLAPVIFAFVPMKFWGKYRKYIAAKRLRRLLENAGPERQALLEKLAIDNEEMLRTFGISREELLKRAGVKQGT
jgi:hypothetical protein